MTARILFSPGKPEQPADVQLQVMLDRLGAGRLLGADRTRHGVMGQTWFVRSTSGEWVLKGLPAYEGQFEEERYFAEQLQARTSVPVPVPYRTEPDTGLFGWSYAVMPRLPGLHLSDPVLFAEAGPDGLEQIAAVLAETLVRLHRWKAEEAGEWDPIRGELQRFEPSYADWLYRSIRYWLSDAERFSTITAADRAWVERLMESSTEAVRGQRAFSYVMGDYKPENILLEREGEDGRSGCWCVSGVIDFTNSYFGDGTMDLTRLAVWYAERGQAELARHFIRCYYRGLGLDERDGFVARFRAHMLYQRILDWGCAHAIGQVTWEAGLGLAEWALPFVELAARVGNEENREGGELRWT